jgi:hypothetical protein
MATQPSAYRQDQAEQTEPQDGNNRRGDGDRRAEDRRRSAKGLFELRARRDRVVEDRRQLERRSAGRFRLAFWRKRDD